jgi:hypothetical protein
VASLEAGACAVPLRPTTRARANVSCVGDGSPALRTTGHGSRRGAGLPGSWTVLFLRAMVEHPAGYAPRLAHCAPRALLPSRHAAPWASGKRRGFGAACSMAHTCACRRIAEAIAGTGARRAPGSGGLTLGRAGFAPAGRQTKCHEGIFSSFPCDQHCLVALKFLYVVFSEAQRLALPILTANVGHKGRRDPVGLYQLAVERAPHWGILRWRRCQKDDELP